jgi:hypothetical protein
LRLLGAGKHRASNLVRPRRVGGLHYLDNAPDLPLAPAAGLWGNGGSMIAPETFNHIENIKKRAGHLWRFL